MAAEVQDGQVTAAYLRGINLIPQDVGYDRFYYQYNAHGDVVTLTDQTGSVSKSYDYTAFGMESDPDADDENPFRYCGEYFDSETGTYYLRARYYDPSIGRFTQPDSHWNSANRIYGDDPQKINEREDALGNELYSYSPEISAIVQSGNLYVYCGNDPVRYLDPTGNEWYHWAIGGAIVAVAAASVVLTAGGAIPAIVAVSSVASGVAASTVASTIAAGAFIGSSLMYGSALLSADYHSSNTFNASADWSTVALTAAGGITGGAYGYKLYQNSNIKIAGRGSTGRTKAKNLNEQLAMKQVKSNPLYGSTNLSARPKHPIKLNDSRWLASEGWVKMQNIVKLSDGSKVTIHFVYNTITHVFDDFKFV